MNVYNPYGISLICGLLMYYLNAKDLPKNDQNKKEKKQNSLNYAFLTTIVVFFSMQYYSTNSSSVLEPTISTKFED